MKKHLFSLVFCTLFALVHCLAQDVESFQIDTKTLKEGKNVVQTGSGVKIYVIVKDKEIVRMFSVDATTKQETEYEKADAASPSLAPAPVPPGGGTGGGTQPTGPKYCFECTCVERKDGFCVRRECTSHICSKKTRG